MSNNYENLRQILLEEEKSHRIYEYVRALLRLSESVKETNDQDLIKEYDDILVNFEKETKHVKTLQMEIGKLKEEGDTLVYKLSIFSAIQSLMDQIKLRDPTNIEIEVCQCVLKQKHEDARFLFSYYESLKKRFAKSKE